MQGTVGATHASVRTWAVALLAVCSVLASSTVAQKAERVDRPNVKVGDQWQFAMSGSYKATAANLSWVVTAVTPTEIRATENGQPLLLTRDMNQVESPRRQDSDLRLLSFPLEVGKAWTYVNDYVLKDSGTKGQQKYSVVVLTYEKVRVPAGEFDAFKLEATGTFSGTAYVGPVSGSSSRTYWYAPAARAIVKDEINDPNRGRYGFELISYKLQP